jgi:sterol desaturase/sphingolipid hydroxylase (fatty acid hydroxylase superfamily)
MLDKLNQLTASHGEPRPGHGLVTGVVALSLSLSLFNIVMGRARWLIVTPNFHPWHHSQDDHASDKNHAAH